MRRQGWIRGCLAIWTTAVLVLAMPPSWAQETTGSISGTVKDPSGAVIPKAKVILRDTEKNVDVRTATTGAGGEFSFAQLPVSQYSLTVEAENFRKFVETGIVPNVNDKLTFFPTLEIGAA